MTTLILVLWFVVVVADAVFYGHAKFPERSRWYFWLPLGGFVAYLKFGPDR